MFRACAESISRIKLPHESHLLEKVLKKNFFMESARNVCPPLNKKFPIPGSKWNINVDIPISISLYFFGNWKTETHVFP